MQRLEKIWRVAEVAGDVGRVTVQVNLLGIDWRNSTVNLLVNASGGTMSADLSTATVYRRGRSDERQRHYHADLWRSEF